MEEVVEPKVPVSSEEMDSKEAEVKEVSAKLDPHGYPLRPQPTNDPKGAAAKSFSNVTCSLLLMRYRSAELELVAQAMGSFSSFVSRLSRTRHPSSHQFFLRATGQIRAYHCRQGILPDNYRHRLRWFLSHHLVSYLKYLWQKAHHDLRYGSRNSSTLCGRCSEII